MRCGLRWTYVLGNSCVMNLEADDQAISTPDMIGPIGWSGLDCSRMDCIMLRPIATEGARVWAERHGDVGEMSGEG
jgi:hypothetical protein